METDSEVTSSSGSSNRELSDRQVQTAESHRGFVREMHEQLGRAYGLGGAAVLVVFAGVFVTAAVTGWWTSPMLWVPGLTAVIAALYLVRSRIYSRRDGLRERVEKYCRVNEVDAEMLCDYYDSEQMYSFFSAIFETPPTSSQE